MKGGRFDPNFYRLPRNPEWTVIIIMMFVFYLSLYRPDSTILDYLGPLGMFVRYMHNSHLGLLFTILYAAAVTHAAEAVYAMYICRKKGLSSKSTLLWTIQTFIFGFPSLLVLVPYKGDNKQS